MLKYRLIFGPLMIAGVVLLFWADTRLDYVTLTGFWQRVFAGRTYPPAGLGLLALAAVLIPLAARELSRLLRAAGIPAHTWLISIASLASCLTIYATPQMLRAPMGVTIIATVLVICFIATLLWHSREANVKGVIAAAGATMFAVILLGLMLGFYLGARRWHSAWVILAIVLITKSGDIGAYFTGRMFGRHKLIPWLSPGKTWEGLIGGVALATLVSVGFAAVSMYTDLTMTPILDEQGARHFQAVRYDMRWAALAGALFALVGHAGDLMISMFKRDAGVKDSGASIPGFGGLLDVIDSPLLVAPVAFWMLHLAAHV